MAEPLGGTSVVITSFSFSQARLTTGPVVLYPSPDYSLTDKSLQE